MKSLVQFSVVRLAGKHPGGVISIDPDKVVAVQSDEHSTAARIYLEGGSSWLVRDNYETVVAEIWDTGATQPALETRRSDREGSPEFLNNRACA